MTSENNKRIAKNTMMLYFRMLLIMGVSLYTVRIVLDALGAVDYGLYNVVGGIVVMFSFLSNTMASASQRFFAFELGKKDYAQLKKTFSMTMTIYVLIAVVILILAETVGLWFLNTQMTIPAERMEAANWVYQFTILSFMMTMFTIPYNAVIIAHERMKVYAWVSIAEAALKLLIVYLLVLFAYDKLKLYAVLMFAVTALITFIYRRYCKRQFEECSYSFYWNKALFRELIGYSGWNLVGAVSAVLSNQGINVLLNIFFGPVVNAARAIAFQASSAITQFSTNFFTAVNPQIIKYYAADEKERMKQLVFQSSKFSYFLVLVLSMPVLLETKFVLTLWLREIPEYVVLFCRLVIITALVNSLAHPLITAALATGKIKKYQLVVGGILLLNLPLSYLFLKMGFPPEITMYIALAITAVSIIARLLMLRKMIRLSIREYFKNVMARVFCVSILSYIPPLFVLFNMEQSWARFLIAGLSSLISTALLIYFLGTNTSERRYIDQLITNRVIKKLKPIFA